MRHMLTFYPRLSRSLKTIGLKTENTIQLLRYLFLIIKTILIILNACKKAYTVNMLQKWISANYGILTRQGSLPYNWYLFYIIVLQSIRYLISCTYKPIIIEKRQNSRMYAQVRKAGSQSPRQRGPTFWNRIWPHIGALREVPLTHAFPNMQLLL